MTELKVTISNARIKQAWVFTPVRYRALANFRGVKIPHYLVVVLGNDKREIAVPAWHDEQDENLRPVLGNLSIIPSSDLLSNSPIQILYDLARRINAYAKITPVLGGLGSFNLIISQGTIDAAYGRKLRIDIRPNSPEIPHAKRLKTLFDVYPEFDLITRANGSHVGHRKHWPLMLEMHHAIPGSIGLNVSLQIDQDGRVELVHDTRALVDNRIYAMDKEAQEKIAKAAYVEVLKGWDVTKMDEIPPLGRILYTKEDMTKAELNGKEVLNYDA